MSIGIDDLLRHEEDGPPRRENRRRRFGGLLRAVLITGGTTAVVIVGLRAVGLTVSVLVIVTGVLAVLAIRRAAKQVAPPPPPQLGRPQTGEEDGSYNFGSRDALRTAINGWERALDWSTGNRERFTEVVLPKIGELADERLRQRHGLTRASDPVRAQALLGDRLWTFLSTPDRRPPSPRDLAAIVAELEKT